MSEPQHDPHEGTLEGCQRELRRIVDQRNRVVSALWKIINLTDGHPVDADRRDRINELAREAVKP